MSENTTDITNDNIQDNNENNSLLTGGSLYESSTDKYKDNLSSAITFFVCGGIGIILMILNDIGIIKIVTKDAPSFLFINIVLGLLFIGFIAIGVLLAVFFKGQIMDLLTNLFGTITEKANSAVSGE